MHLNVQSFEILIEDLVLFAASIMFANTVFKSGRLFRMLDILTISICFILLRFLRYDLLQWHRENDVSSNGYAHGILYVVDEQWLKSAYVSIAWYSRRSAPGRAGVLIYLQTVRAVARDGYLAWYNHRRGTKEDIVAHYVSVSSLPWLTAKTVTCHSLAAVTAKWAREDFTLALLLGSLLLAVEVGSSATAPS